MQAAHPPFNSPERRLTRPPLRETPTHSSSASWDTTHSSASWETQTVVGDDEDDELGLISSSPATSQPHHASLPRDVSSRLEPFNAMPIKLDRFAEALVSFYLLQYPAATYVFNQNLNPHPVYTNFAIAMNAPACFQVILARSALYKKSAGQYGTSLERAELDTAVMEHKTNAIHRVRQLSQMKTGGSKDELVASIISLGTLEMRMGSTQSGDVHYSAVRKLLKSIGGPMQIRDLRLKRVMCFFECIYGTPRNSYIWDREDFGGILERFNEYLGEMWERWTEREGTVGSPGTIVESSSGFPFPSPTAKPPSETSQGTANVSRRKPTGPHSPYFGLQPPPEVVPQPTQRLAPTIQPPPLTATDVPTASQAPPAALARAPKASSSTKRPARSDTRPPAKERARNVERQRQKQRAMQIDTPDPAGAIPQSHHPLETLQSSAEAMPPPTPRRKPSIDRRSYWKLHSESPLHRRLSLWTELSPEKQQQGLIWDLACLFCLSAVASDYATRDVKSLATYMSKLAKIVHDANLHVSENNSNTMWLIQTNDASEEHSRRMWEVAAFTWICKHLNGSVCRRLREWVFAFLVGGKCQRRIVLTAFDFSYDSELV